MSTHILFVCTGNTCRSPMAEALAEARGISAESAGMSAARGDGAAPNAERALREVRGLSVRSHTPRDVSDVDLTATEQIVAMSPAVARRLRDEHDVPLDRVVTWAIPDPYGGSFADYRWCLEEIRSALDDLLASG